jgi:hypothetical protein
MSTAVGQPQWLAVGLGVLLALSLLGNVVILIAAWRIRNQVRELGVTVTGMLQTAIIELRGFEHLTMHFTVRVNDKIPVRSRLAVRDTVDISVQTIVPIKQTVQSDILINAPLLNTKVPVSVAVPIDMAVPIDLQLPVEIDSQIPVNLDIPVQLEVPVALDLAQTELGGFIEQVRDSLVSLKDLLDKANG